jgi:hypothetical protein
MERFKNWGLWVALASLITFVVLKTTGADIGTDMNTFLTILLPVLSGLGIVSTHDGKGIS